ncbi:hypothetical protein Acr_10g0007000 [Actinidia rufa]|uniref:Uncharacterized protein n=1 Tax=Actinidia rufa TaxID=165716 RepID=A0A7J0F9H0_9ERIC|nr:hypothetical protein Acr_10g0007000 [Actinidia rufa]
MGELAKLDRASNSAQQEIATRSKNSLLMEELAKLEKSSELCSVRFVKDAGQNHISELAKLDQAHSSAQLGLATLSKILKMGDLAELTGALSFDPVRLSSNIAKYLKESAELDVGYRFLD